MIVPLRRYASFRGRSRRREYWLFQLLIGLAPFATAQIEVATGVVGHKGAMIGIVMLVFLLPALAVGIRRLRDTDRSGWRLLLGIVPLPGVVALLALFCAEGTGGPTDFGEDPKDLG